MKTKFIIIPIVAIVLISVAVVLFLLNIHSKASHCGIENCHGMDIKCGSNIPDACTMIYQIGDICREHAKCHVYQGKCQLTKNDSFEKCKNCVQKCIDENKNQIEKQFDCEATCGRRVIE